MEVALCINLQRIFVFFRFDIKKKVNCQIADIIIQVINDNVSNKEMCEMIFDIMPEWREQLIVKDGEDKKLFYYKELEVFIIRALELIKCNILNQNYDIAYDIADILHVFPEIILANQKKGLKQYWKTYVKPFQKKWNCNLFDDFKHIFR